MPALGGELLTLILPLVLDVCQAIASQHWGISSAPSASSSCFFLFLLCDRYSIYALPWRSAACCFLTFFIFFLLLLSSSAHIFPHPLFLAFTLLLSLSLTLDHSVLPCLVFPICSSFGSPLFSYSVCFFVSFQTSHFTPLSLLVFIIPKCSAKLSAYLPFPITTWDYLSQPFISSLSPPLVLQDIRGGDRLLQPLLSNDLSGGAVLSQEIGGLPLHHPHRRYWRVICTCAFVCVCVCIGLHVCIYVLQWVFFHCDAVTVPGNHSDLEYMDDAHISSMKSNCRCSEAVKHCIHIIFGRGAALSIVMVRWWEMSQHACRMRLMLRVGHKAQRPASGVEITGLILSSDSRAGGWYFICGFHSHTKIAAVLWFTQRAHMCDS